jgi:Na+/H+ antiporter NhaC
MYQQEQIAQTSGNLFGNKPALKHAISFPDNHRGSLWDFLFPTTILASAVVIMLLYTGNATLLCGQRSISQAITHADIFLSLFVASTVATILTTCFLLFRKKIILAQLPWVAYEGFRLMFNVVAVLILAWAFSTLLKDDIQTGFYVAHKLMGTVHIPLAPIVFFLITALTSLIIGSSWGTIAIMIPFAIPMLTTLLKVPLPTTIEQVPSILPALGAIISGAVIGDHLSYIIPIGVSTACAFLMVGLLSSYNPIIAIVTSLTVGIIMSFMLLMLGNRLRKNRFKPSGAK